MLKGRTVAMKSNSLTSSTQLFNSPPQKNLYQKIFVWLYCKLFRSITHLLLMVVSKTRGLGKRVWANIQSSTLCFPSRHLVYHVQNDIILGEKVDTENNQAWSKYRVSSIFWVTVIFINPNKTKENNNNVKMYETLWTLSKIHVLKYFVWIWNNKNVSSKCKVLRNCFGLLSCSEIMYIEICAWTSRGLGYWKTRKRQKEQSEKKLGGS